MADGDLTVLIVDDHRMFAESLARLLADEPGIAVAGTVVTAEAALAVATRERPGVVLVDYHMPTTNGAVLAGQLKALDPDVHVVMLTGFDDDRILLDAIEAGCSGFLTKEQAASEVADAVRAVADGEALISPAMLARLLPQLRRRDDAPAATLTVRERQVLAGVARGLTNRAIAEELYLSVNTIRNYVQAILTKLGAHSKLEAVSLAVRAGLLDYPTG